MISIWSRILCSGRLGSRDYPLAVNHHERNLSSRRGTGQLASHAIGLATLFAYQLVATIGEATCLSRERDATMAAHMGMSISTLRPVVMSEGIVLGGVLLRTVLSELRILGRSEALVCSRICHPFLLIVTLS